MADDPWIIHGYIVFSNYWGGYYIGCRMIHGYIVFPNYWGGYYIGWQIHGYIVFLSYCVRGQVLSLATLPSLDYSCIVMVHSDGTCYLQPSMDSPRLA